ncbi:hypothetical protein Drorol1_Dr00000369, partial [Drosera rotundifolia]
MDLGFVEVLNKPGCQAGLGLWLPESKNLVWPLLSILLMRVWGIVAEHLDFLRLLILSH